MKFKINVRREIAKIYGPVCDLPENKFIKNRFQEVGHSDLYERALELSEFDAFEFDDEIAAEKAIEQIERLVLRIATKEMAERYPAGFFDDMVIENGAAFYVESEEI